MTWILDVIIILIIGLTIFFAAKKGFIKTLISAVSFVIAIIVTVMLCEPFAEILKDTAIAKTIETATKEQITDIILNESHEIDALLDGESEQFNTFVTIAGYDRAELANWFDANVANSDTAESMLAKKIAEPIIDTIALLLAIIILYAGTQIILWIVSLILDLVANLPVLRSCNTLLGIILGAALALVRVCLFCFAVEILIENSAFLGSDLIESLSPEKTVLYKFFSEIDIFSFLR